MALGSTQPLTEMSTRNLPGCKRRPAHKADNFTAVREQIVLRKYESLDVSQPYGPSRPLKRIAFSDDHGNAFIVMHVPAFMVLMLRRTELQNCTEIVTCGSIKYNGLRFACTVVRSNYYWIT
jgi:hypothetical protein